MSRYPLKLAVEPSGSTPMDPNDLEGIFRTYGRVVFRRARAILGEADAANDIVQEVFLRVVSARDEFAAVLSPVDWLYRVTTNLCLKRIRDRASRERILRTSSPAPASPAPERAADVTLTVRAMLRSVPESLQEIAIYYFVDQMSQDEIAELIGIPRRTVSYRLAQFRTAALSGAYPWERSLS
jgi:RNA polymerase sigma-70 factor (ECF subfamily)